MPEIGRLYAAARLHVNFFQPSFKLKEKQREGPRVIKRYHPPATPYQRALAQPKLGKAIKQRLRGLYRTLDPVALMGEIRAARASTAGPARVLTTPPARRPQRRRPRRLHSP